MVMHCNHAFPQMLQKALGLPSSGVRWFELRVAYNEAVTVKVEYMPDTDQDWVDAEFRDGKAVCLNDYVLVKKGEAP